MVAAGRRSAHFQSSHSSPSAPSNHENAAYDRGRESRPSLRTGLAGLPHPALRLVVHLREEEWTIQCVAGKENNTVMGGGPFLAGFSLYRVPSPRGPSSRWCDCHASVILRMSCSPPVAPHPASRRRSYLRLQAGERMPEEDFHLPDHVRLQAHERARLGRSPGGRDVRHECPSLLEWELGLTAIPS